MADAPQLRVVEGQAKNRLFFGNLPKQLTKEEVLAVLRKSAVGGWRGPAQRALRAGWVGGGGWEVMPNS